MEKIKWNRSSEGLPPEKQKVIFIISPHYGGPEFHYGTFVPNYETHLVTSKDIFVGNYDSFWRSEQVEYWADVPTPTIILPQKK